jgi:hypothetical protein
MKRLIVACVLAAVAVAVPVAPAHAKARGRVLATGDSMIQLVDSQLATRLAARHYKLKSDAHVGTGLSKPFLLDWIKHSRSEAKHYRPAVSVVFLGANEGFPLQYGDKEAHCCSKSWIRAYADRARQMMRELERGGHSHVYWLTLPAARPGNWNHIYTAVNAALRMASKGEDGVTLLDMGRVFTPKGRFQQTIVYKGRRVSVRQGDGIHLNVSGAKIAAGVVYKAMVREKVI